MPLNPHLYYPIYMGLMALLTIGLSVRYAGYSNAFLRKRKEENIYPSLILMIALTLFIGLRPLSGVFVDMMNYNEFYHALHYGKHFTFDWDADNLLFDNIFSYMGSREISIEYFFLLIAGGYFGCMWLAMRKMFPDDTLYAFVICLSAFSTFSYGTNGIKAGIAASVFLFALAYRKKLVLSLLLALISWGFHHSMQVLVVAYMIVLIIKNPKYYLIFWLICVALSFFKITYFQELFANITDDQGKTYLEASSDKDWGGKTGFRIDFLLYSMFPLFIAYWVIVKKKIRSANYNLLVNLYLLVNGIWVLCMYVPFNNRIAYLSWFMLPVVSIYPFFRIKVYQRQYLTVNIIAWFYLLFTIGMVVIYYGMLG